MENLSLKDRRRPQSIAFGHREDTYNRFASRLPTPEESLPSQRSSDDERRNKVTRRFSPDRAHSRDPSFHGRSKHDTLSPALPQRHFPDSPPYQASDAQRPSLPPLKTILGSSLTSPPRSPTVPCSSVQPSPQEPPFSSYTTYKPPSLYPQKKQRTDYVLEPVPPLSSIENASSPLFTTQAFHPQTPHAEHAASPRSVQVPNQQQPAHSAHRSTRSPYLEPRHSRPSANEHYQGASGSVVSPREYNATSARHGNESSARFARRDSAQATYGSAYPGIARQAEVRTVDEQDSHPRAALNGGFDAVRYARGPEQHASERRQETPYTSYQATQPSFFMPSQYDYRQGRARKRSNLPKQSTEIMKTWFDQNIANPYPSEEQKAVFSNATGISMTQVSNWFINHRRRCPELRDKRERTRGREGDV